MPKDAASKMIQELAMIAHELRRPIETIAKSAELVNRAQAMSALKEEKLHEIMDGIITNCHRLSLLTNNIMEIANIENGNVKLIVEKLDLNIFLDELKEFLSLYEYVHNVKFVFKVSLKDPLMTCDFKKLERIILNFVSNAVKYSKNTNRRVTITVSDKDEYITFSVKDRGIGIEKKNIDKIFDKFYRIESFSTRQTEGCGLGLTIVKRFIEVLNGEISVTSEVGKGSEFTVKIPRVSKSRGTACKILELSRSYQMYKTSVDEIFADIQK